MILLAFLKLQLVSKPQWLTIRVRHLVRGSRGRRVEKRRPPQRGLRPAQVRDLRGSHAAGALYCLRDHASPRSPQTRR